MPCLISTGGHLLEFRSFPARFGTSPDNEIVVQEGLGVMEHHFTLRREGVRIVLESKGRSATTVNGNDVRRANIQDGDRLQVGQLMLVPIPGLVSDSGSGKPQSARNQVVSDAMSGFSEMTESPFEETSGALDPPLEMADPLASELSPETAFEQSDGSAVAETASVIPADSTEVPSITDPADNSLVDPAVVPPTPAAEARSSVAADPGGPETTSFAATQDPVPAADNPFAGMAVESSASAEEPTAVQSTSPDAGAAGSPGENLIAAPQDSATAMPASESFAGAVVESSAQAPPADNPFADAIVDRPESFPSEVTVSPTATPPREPSVSESAPVESPSEPLLESDPNLEAIFETAEESLLSESDLAKVFEESEDEMPTITPVPAEPVEVPPIPEISEAEKSGATVEASELPSKDINPIGSLINRRRPAPPARTVPPSTVTPQAAEKPDPSMSEEDQPKKAKKSRRAKRSRRKKNATPGVAGRLERTKQEPKYRTQIPWHKVAIFFCVVFAGAGAYLATQGQSYVDKYLGMLGMKSDPAHHSYLSRLGSADLTFMLTVDADRFVRFYRKWAVDTDDWMTVADLEKLLRDSAGRIQLSNLDRVTLAMNAQGEMLTLISTKSDLNRQGVMRDLGRGVLVSERVGNVALHEGFVGKRHAVRFAILNAKTMVIGDPSITTKFVSASAPEAQGSSLDNPAQTLAGASNDLLGCFYTKGALTRLKGQLPKPLLPVAERLMGFMQTGEAEQEKVLARVGMDLKIDGVFTFGSEAKAKAFASGWKGEMDGRLQALLSLLGAHASVMEGSSKDLDACVVHAIAKDAKLNLSVPNRWASMGADSAREMLGYLVDAFQKKPIEKAPSLLTGEELEARAIARQVEHEYAQSLAAGSKVLVDVRDIETIVKTLQGGVRGEGAYRKVVYKVPKSEGRLRRVLELLEWKGDELVMTIREPSMLASDPEEES